MKRLTQWYDDGKIRGVLVKDGYEENALQIIVTKIDECYAAVALLKDYEDTGLTPPEIMELVGRDAAKDLKDLEKENVAKDELRKSFVNHIADILIGLNGAAKTEAEKELVFRIAVTVKDNIEFIPDGEES